METTIATIVILPAQPADYERLLTIFTKAVRHGTVADYSKEQRMAWAPDMVDRDQWSAKRGHHPTWVAEYQGKKAGFIDLTADGHIDMLYVHPDVHRKGIATALLAHVQKVATQQGVRTLTTEASLTAQHCFEKAGFTTITSQTVFRNGEIFTNFRMEKAL